MADALNTNCSLIFKLWCYSDLFDIVEFQCISFEWNLPLMTFDIVGIHTWSAVSPAKKKVTTIYHHLLSYHVILTQYKLLSNAVVADVCKSSFKSDALSYMLQWVGIRFDFIMSLITCLNKVSP